jgi:hypothetical protein
MEQVAVMQNIFFGRKISRIFDLKGSLRGRFAAHMHKTKDDDTDAASRASDPSGGHRRKSSAGPDRQGRGFAHSASSDINREAELESGTATLLDGDFLEFTLGRPMPMTDSAKAVFQMSILNVSDPSGRLGCGSN